MRLDTRILSGIGSALNEGLLHGAEYEPNKNILALSVETFLMNERGEVPQDKRVIIILYPVFRIAASLRPLHQQESAVIPFEVKNLLEVVQSFEAPPIQGSLLDVGKAAFQKWQDHLSLDFCPELAELNELMGSALGREVIKEFHTIDFLLENYEQHLNLRIWFKNLRIFRVDGKEIDVEKFIAAASRWRASVRRNDAA